MLPLILTLVFEAAFLWLLFELGAFTPPPQRVQRPLVTFDMVPVTQGAPPKAAPSAAKPRAAVTPPKQPQVERSQSPIPQPPFIPMSHSDFAASDIGKLGHSAGSSGSSTAAYGPGEGPNGAPLYNAEWYRKPSENVLAPYLKPGGPRPEWAVVACLTAPNMRVENCRSLGESPIGSGLAAALRQAAWQFQVVPPRVGNKPMIGVWVRIRFDFIERKADPDAPRDPTEDR